MIKISDSVGQGGKNKVSDVALVQAMLVLIKNDKNTSYLDSYDGTFGDHTGKAILAFQNDQVFAPDAQGGSVRAPVRRTDPGFDSFIETGVLPSAAGPVNAKPGLVSPGDATLSKLVAMLPDTHKELRVLDGAKTVYIASTDDDLKSSKQDLSSRTINDHFKVKVAALFGEMYKKNSIVLWVTPEWADGGLRTFQKQYELLFKLDENGNHVTNSGPGESNHNFGQAVDIGFIGLRWLKSDGTIVEKEDAWLHKLIATSHGEAKAQLFWDAMRDIATNGDAGLFRGPVSDHPHVQAWDDHLVDMADRLADLMTQVGAMTWTGRWQKYKCDFGLGGDCYPVGSARDIWNLQGKVTAGELAKARTAAASSGGGKPVKPSDIKPADIAEMQAALKADFQAAEDHWEDWSPH